MAGNALALRNRLLAALLAEEGAQLFRAGDDLAVVQTPRESRPLLLVTYSDALGLAELKARLARLAEGLRVQSAHLVVVGGGPDVFPLLASLHRTESWGRRFYPHHVDDLGRLATVGPRLRALEDAAAAMPRLAPLSDDQLRAQVEAGQLRQAEAARLGQAIRGQKPRVTIALIAACAAIFALEWKFGDGEPARVFLAMGADNGQRVLAGEWWRLLASTFLHANLVHIGVNMVALWSFGQFLEAVFGGARLLVLYALCGLGGGLASALLHPAVVAVGASGAIWGLMTAGYAIALRPRGLLPPLAAAHLRRTLFWPFIANVGLSLLPGIDLFAHFGGGLVGALLGASGLLAAGVRPVWRTEGRLSRQEPALRAVMIALAVACAAAMTASVALALVHGRPWDVAAAATAAP